MAAQVSTMHAKRQGYDKLSFIVIHRCVSVQSLQYSLGDFPKQTYPSRPVDHSYRGTAFIPHAPFTLKWCV